MGLSETITPDARQAAAQHAHELEHACWLILRYLTSRGYSDGEARIGLGHVLSDMAADLQDGAAPEPSAKLRKVEPQDDAAIAAAIDMLRLARDLLETALGVMGEPSAEIPESAKWFSDAEALLPKIAKVVGA